MTGCPRGVALFGHQRHLAVVVDEADARQPLVRDALAETDEVQVAQIHAPLRQGLVELHHQRLVLGADGADGDLGAVLERPRSDVLRRVGADRERRQLVLGARSASCSTTRASSAISRSARGQQRIDVDLLDPALLDDQLAEAHQQLLQRGQVDRLAAAHALERLVRSCVCSIMRRASVVLSGGSASARSLKTSTSWPPDAEQQHRAELRVDAAAEDQFVAVELDHRLHGDALEVLARPPSGRHGVSNRVERACAPRRRPAGSTARRPRRSCA